MKIENIQRSCSFNNKGNLKGKVTSIEIVEKPILKYQNCFVATFTYMQGDGDGYPFEEIVFKQDSHPEKIIDFLNFALACSRKYPSGKGGCDHYQDVPGYEYWVEWSDDYEHGKCSVTDQLIAKYGDCKENMEYLSWDMEDGEYYSSFESVSVSWFDEKGVEHAVNIVLK